MLSVRHGLNDCLDQIDRLGVFPAAASQILELSRRPDATLDQLEEAVALDSTLTGRVLKVANSPLYARQVRIGTLRRALQMLGFTGTRDIAIALAIAAVSRERAPQGEALWRHSLCTAWTCRVIARHGRGISGDVMFVGGLLHDLGLTLMLVLENDTVRALMDRYGWESQAFFDAELEHFGFSHATLGAACLRRWKLPLETVDLVEWHHEPIEVGDGKLANPRSRAVLAIADHLSTALLGGESVAPLFDQAMAHPSADLMRISRGGLLAALEQLVELREELDNLD